MNTRFWGIVIIVLAAIIVVGVVYVIFFYQPSEPAAPAAPLTEQPAATTTPLTQAPLTQAPAEITPAEQPSLLKQAGIKADDLARLARSFAERFGSFSNQSDYGNVRDLRVFMTDSLKVWADNYVAEARAKRPDTSIYYGLVTKAVSAEVKLYDADAGLAEILVKTQRRESSGFSANSSTYYQDILIKYRREQGVWRVDGLYWQER